MIGRVGRHVFACAAILFLICHGASTHAAEFPWKIDERTAQRLAAEAYDHGMDPKWFDHYRSPNSPFFEFDGLNQSSNGSFGFFAVNPWTGDVWALWGCHKLSTAASRKLCRR